MADSTKTGGIGVTTADARHGDVARAFDPAAAMAWRGPVSTDEKVAGLVPRTRYLDPGEQTYVMLEHRRRDTAAIARALDLTAPDAPAGRVLPVPGPDGRSLLAYAVMCVTHDSDPVYCPSASRARKEARSSHTWCPGCHGDRSRA